MPNDKLKMQDEDMDEPVCINWCTLYYLLYYVCPAQLIRFLHNFLFVVTVVGGKDNHYYSDFVQSQINQF